MTLQWGTEIFLLLAGWVLGLISPLVARPVGRWWTTFRGRRDELKVTSTGRDHGFFTLNSWSPRRSLEPQHVDVGYIDDSAVQTWVPADVLAQYRRGIEDEGGPAATLRALSVDHRESKSGQTLYLRYGPSFYGDLLAVGACFESEPNLLGEVWDRLERTDVQEMIHGAPKSVTAMNVTITSADRKLLAVRRSSAVRTSQNEWTLGPNETMFAPAPTSGGTETPFQLASRCLQEEVELHAADIKDLYVSWVGYNVPGALCHWVTHVVTNLRSGEVTERLTSSHGAFEVDGVDWLPFEHKVLDMIENSCQSGVPDRHGRRWNRTAALAAGDIRRWRATLLRDL